MTRVAATRHPSVPVGSAARRSGVVRTLLAGLALLFVCAFPAQGGGARAEDELRVITTGDYSPFVYTDASGALAGFEIDFAKALCAILAVRCQFIDLPFEETIPALLAGRGDAIIAS